MEMTTINMISLGGGNEVEGRRNNPQRERERGSHVLSFQSSPLPLFTFNFAVRGRYQLSFVPLFFLPPLHQRRRTYILTVSNYLDPSSNDTLRFVFLWLWTTCQKFVRILKVVDRKGRRLRGRKKWERKGKTFLSGKVFFPWRGNNYIVYSLVYFYLS